MKFKAYYKIKQFKNIVKAISLKANYKFFNKIDKIWLRINIY